VNITNNGPDNAPNINVTLTGEGADMEPNAMNQTEIVPRDSGVSWYPPTLHPGETAWLLANLTANGSGVFYLNGTALSDVSDPVPENNNGGISITINTPPVAGNDSYTLQEDCEVTTLNVLDNDSDAEGNNLTISSVTQPSNGTVSIIDGGKNVSYQPDADWYGTDSFTYTVSDGNGGTGTATVTVTVNPVNDPPVITTEELPSGNAGESYSFTLESEDADGGSPVWSGNIDVNGLNLLSSGTIEGTPELAGDFNVEITVSDGNGGSDTRNYTLHIAGTEMPQNGTLIGVVVDSDGNPVVYSTIFYINKLEKAEPSSSSFINFVPTPVRFMKFNSNPIFFNFSSLLINAVCASLRSVLPISFMSPSIALINSISDISRRKHGSFADMNLPCTPRIN